MLRRTATRIFDPILKCFQDNRNLSYVDYPVHQLLAQRVYGIVLGYEDVNDHDKLRYVPALAIALEKLDFINSTELVILYGLRSDASFSSDSRILREKHQQFVYIGAATALLSLVKLPSPARFRGRRQGRVKANDCFRLEFLE